MWNGKNKAVTFSYDDGVVQDFRLVALFNRYGLKSTFNINSELLGLKEVLVRSGVDVCHDKIRPSELKELYKGHEVAVHTLTHPNLTLLDEAEIIRQVEEDRKNLEKLAGYEIIGMAYPCGGVNNDDRVAEIIRNNTKIKYSRTITSTHSFDLQENLLRFNPTAYTNIPEETEDAVDRFLKLETDKPKLLYIWGHAYEFDINDRWGWFEKICEKLSGHDDIFYGTNKEVFFG